MALNTSIERQFEFLQQQWFNYANDSKEGSDKDGLLGNHDADRPSKMVIHADPKSGQSRISSTKSPLGGDPRRRLFLHPEDDGPAMIAARVDPT
jgi:hypothetical protein